MVIAAFKILSLHSFGRPKEDCENLRGGVLCGPKIELYFSKIQNRSTDNLYLFLIGIFSFGRA
jgi:hypothetical protein